MGSVWYLKVDSPPPVGNASLSPTYPVAGPVDLTTIEIFPDRLSAYFSSFSGMN